MDEDQAGAGGTFLAILLYAFFISIYYYFIDSDSLLLRFILSVIAALFSVHVLSAVIVIVVYLLAMFVASRKPK